MELVWPSAQHLSSYASALQRGWSPDTQRPDAAVEELSSIAADPVAFVTGQVDRDARGGDITLPDGSTVTRLPSLTQWLWDGEFCGVIKARWQPGTTELPPTCLGHVGYSVVPWKRGRGYATRALALFLPELQTLGLPFIELTTDPQNVASQRVILANGGWFVGEFRKPMQHGGGPGWRYRIAMGPQTV